MAKAKEIGVDAPQKRQCAHCNEKFGWHEFSSFILSPRKKVLTCIVCTKLNFIIIKHTIIPMLIAFLLALGIFCALVLMALGSGIIFIGTSITAGFFYFLLKVYYWNCGHFSKTSYELEAWDPFNDNA